MQAQGRSSGTLEAISDSSVKSAAARSSCGHEAKRMVLFSMKRKLLGTNGIESMVSTRGRIQNIESPFGHLMEGAVRTGGRAKATAREHEPAAMGHPRG